LKIFRQEAKVSDNFLTAQNLHDLQDHAESFHLLNFMQIMMDGGLHKETDLTDVFFQIVH